MNSVLESFKRAKVYEQPWRHYETSSVLDEDMHNFVRNYNFPDTSIIEQHPEKFCLPRKFDRVKALAHRKHFHRTLSDNRHSCEVNFTKTLREQNKQANQLFSLFLDPELIQFLEKIGPYSLKDTYLRVQLIKDLQEYSIKPHTDLQKRFTLLLHYCTETETNLGTDLYDIKGEQVIKTSTYGENSGMFFFPNENTWHGYIPKPINNQRISLMVNYFYSFPKYHDILDEDGMYVKI